MKANCSLECGWELVTPVVPIQSLWVAFTTLTDENTAIFQLLLGKISNRYCFVVE